MSSASNQTNTIAVSSTSTILNLLLEETEELQSSDQKVELHSILYIPFISIVFCGPILFILVFCYIQRRNRKLQRRDIERLQNRRLSTQSGIYVGVQFAGSLPFSAGCQRTSPSSK
uniref:Uncharacterized protein n=1 Tax=Ditylenchus dipsaci TaxID=166011 RepID=A0A915EVI0_9BILA